MSCVHVCIGNQVYLVLVGFVSTIGTIAFLTILPLVFLLLGGTIAFGVVAWCGCIKICASSQNNGSYRHKDEVGARNH